MKMSDSLDTSQLEAASLWSDRCLCQVPTAVNIIDRYYLLVESSMHNVTVKYVQHFAH